MAHLDAGRQAIWKRKPVCGVRRPGPRGGGRAVRPCRGRRPADSAQRGFLLTGDRLFLEPVQRANDSLFAGFAEVMRAAADDGMLEGRMSELKRLASGKMDRIRRTIELYQRGQTAAALALFRGRGNSGMDEVRRVIDELRAPEERRLADRTLKAP